MCNWLLEKDDYTPLKDRDVFLSRNVLSIFGILSTLRRKKSNDDTWIYRVSVLLKIIFTLLFIVSLSFTRHIIYAAIVNVYMLSFLLFMNRYDSKRIIKLFISVILFSFLVVIPSLFFYPSIYNALLLVLRITASIISVNVLVYSCLPHQITGCMNRLFVPDLLIIIFDLTLKYIILLGDCAMEMFQALALRSVGVNRKKTNTVFNIFGAIFLKSKNYSEALYDAMICRCFDGNYSRTAKLSFKFGLSDVCYIAVSSVILGTSLL